MPALWQMAPRKSFFKWYLRHDSKVLLCVSPQRQPLVMPVKHSLVGVLHEQGGPGRVPMQGNVIGAEGMPQDVTVLGEASLLEGSLLLPIVDRSADILFMHHVFGRLDPCPDGLGQPLQDLALT